MPALALRLFGWLTWLLQPLLRIKLAQRARNERGYLEAVEERFGHYTQTPEHNAGLVWVHAVSLGETRTAAVLIQALRRADPQLRFLITHGTATGRAEGRALLGPDDVQVWQPWDTPAAVARFFAHFQPRIGLLMETEVWPCTVAGAQRAGVPLVLVNARLSARSLRQAQDMAWLARPAFAALAQVYAQTPDDARRLQQIGARVDGVFGNLKFDAAPGEDQQTQGHAWRRALGQPVLLFASSRDGEEAAFLKEISAVAQSNRAQTAIEWIADTTRQVGAVTRSFKPLIVPRHPQRFDDVQALVEAQGLRVSRRSSWPAAGPLESIEAMQADVWLGDSLGEMALYYAISDVALLGGSFAPLGGQNLIEAAACGCPVVMGPHTFNFSEAAELAQTEGAAIRVADMQEGVRSASRLVNEPPALAKMANAGLTFAAQNRGATERTLAALMGYW